jgi:hypothetical protein
VQTCQVYIHLLPHFRNHLQTLPAALSLIFTSSSSSCRRVCSDESYPDTPANFRQCWHNAYKQVSSGPREPGIRLREEGLDMAAYPRSRMKNTEAPMCVGCMSVGFGWKFEKRPLYLHGKTIKSSRNNRIACSIETTLTSTRPCDLSNGLYESIPHVYACISALEVSPP